MYRGKDSRLAWCTMAKILVSHDVPWQRFSSHMMYHGKDSCLTGCTHIVVCMCIHSLSSTLMLHKGSWTSVHAACNNTFMGMRTVFIPHTLCCGMSPPCTVMELLVCLQHLRREKRLLIRLLWVMLLNLCVRWLKKQVQSCLLVHFHHDALSLFDKVSSYFTP